MPDYIILGAQKAGTTSLQFYLNQHPTITRSRIKEVFFFNKYYNLGTNWYRSFFPLKWLRGNRITGEATPNYLFNPETPSRIKKLIPQIKLIVLLRDPVRRAESDYHFSMRKDYFEFDGSFLDLVEREKNAFNALSGDIVYSKESKQAVNYSILRKSYYGIQLERWLQFFPKEQFLFLKSEDFFADPKSALSEVYQFLGVDQVFPKNLKKLNSTNYNSMAKEDYLMIQDLYKEDAIKLESLIGDKFKWDFEN